MRTCFNTALNLNDHSTRRRPVQAGGVFGELS